MSTIIVVPDPNGGVGFRAISGEHSSQGEIAGKALDNLFTVIGEPTEMTLITIHSNEDEPHYCESPKQ